MMPSLRSALRPTLRPTEAQRSDVLIGAPAEELEELGDFGLTRVSGLGLLGARLVRARGVESEPIAVSGRGGRRGEERESIAYWEIGRIGPFIRRRGCGGPQYKH